MYEFGFSVMEKVYEDREWSPRKTGANRRVYTMLRKLAPQAYRDSQGDYV